MWFGVFPCQVLGLDFGMQGQGDNALGTVVSTIRKCFDSWKARYLSFGGRLVLIKSVLSNLPVYFLLILKAPLCIVAKSEAIQRRFLWEGCEDKINIQWIKWDVVKTSRHLGGLGFIDGTLLNKALLAKWDWRFAVEHHAWWRELMIARCGLGESSWQPFWTFSLVGWSLWRWLVKESHLFWDYGFVDPGGLVSFWEDSVRLALSYPRVAVASRSSGAFVHSFAPSCFRSSWTVSLSISLRGGALWEMQQLIDLLASLSTDFILTGRPTVTWPLNNFGAFSVQSIHNLLRINKFGGCSEFPASVIWCALTPTKVQCFV
ncbi:Putative ribonuclease H protein At1g65750 [Linum perenne]